MIHAFSRSELLLGTEALETLRRSRVAVFGVGGVGGYAVEALARSGVGELHLVDNDTVSLTNINRQIIALHSTVGRAKVDVMRERVLDINPDCRVFTYNTFFTPETAGDFDFTRFDYVVDAIDTVSGKIQITVSAREAGVPVICAMAPATSSTPPASRWRRSKRRASARWPRHAAGTEKARHFGREGGLFQRGADGAARRGGDGRGL